eukprot:m.666013 g.666013  ORF g.666013 m.666013 type:complete len:52 (+) comp58500_c0_seq9:1430-1585(+)
MTIRSPILPPPCVFALLFFLLHDHALSSGVLDVIFHDCSTTGGRDAFSREP